MPKTSNAIPVLISAIDLPLERLVQLLNLAYEGYYFPIHLSVEQFERMCHQEDIDLAQSVVAMAGRYPVGAALLSIRGRAGWVSGVGVLPSMRRRGIASRMVSYLQGNARSAGLHTLQLEVLVQNGGALALYQQHGFALRRDLEILLLEMWDYRAKVGPANVAPVAPKGLLACYDAFHRVSAPWQRQKSSLEHRLPDLEGLALWEESRLAGYLLYDGSLGTYSILDIAVDPAHPRPIDVAQALLQTAYQAHTRLRRYVINNLPADDPLLPAFTGLGFGYWYRQHELVWETGA